MSLAATNANAVPSAARLVPPRGERPSRYLSWLGAFVLLVLVATAGLPDTRHGAVSAPAIEAVERAVVRPTFGKNEQLVLPARLAAEVAIVPRAPGRTRSVHSRGLPPTRAPCA